MEPHRFRAPKADGSLLAEPALGEAGSVLAANALQLGRWDHDFQGRRSGRLRAMARKEILDRANSHLSRFGQTADPAPPGRSPVIVTGHQPELFHAGVWIKNFAVAALAKNLGGSALNLIVDNDVPKSAGIRVPARADGRLRAEVVAFDEWAGEVPYEDWHVQREDQFSTFGGRALQALDGLVPDPILADLWPGAIEAASVTDRVGLRFSKARRDVERSFGVANAELPLSEVCETEAFRWFACHLLAQLPRFRSVHNAALARYRALYGIRSKNHPVPRLDREGEWVESPFWAWRESNPRRRPLMARQGAETLDLRIAGEDDILGRLRLTPDREACCAVEDLAEIASRGIRVRTRALTTTMFARLLLGDLFLHGIGGAKYDELGDELFRGFFGIDPPRYLTLSLTLWLGLDVDASAAEARKALDRRIRDLRFNPDRALAGSADPQVRSWIDAKARAIAGPVESRGRRVGRFREIRRLNQALFSHLDEARRELEGRRVEVDRRLRENAIATSREWSFAIHSRRGWSSALARIFPPGRPL